MKSLGRLVWLALLGAVAIAKAHDVQPLDMDPHMPVNGKPVDAPEVLNAEEDGDVSAVGAEGKKVTVHMDADEQAHVAGVGEPPLCFSCVALCPPMPHRATMAGEIAAEAVMAGQKLVKGTVDTVDYKPLITQKKVAKMKQHIKEQEKKLGEEGNGRQFSLLLSHGSFVMGAASREDGSGEEREMDAQSLIQAGEGSKFLEQDLGDDMMDDLEGGTAQASDDEDGLFPPKAPRLELDSEEQNMVEEAVDASHKSKMHDGDFGESMGLKLPAFPLIGKAPMGGPCRDKAYSYVCGHWKKVGKCGVKATADQCAKTCGLCGSNLSNGVAGSGRFAPPKPKNPNDCVVSKWTWSTCSDRFNGKMSASRTVLKQNKGNGAPCPTLKMSVPCNMGQCHPSCQTCKGAEATDCLSCFNSRNSALNAAKLTTYGKPKTTAAWDPEKREKLLYGESAWHFKMLDLKTTKGMCVWEDDIVTKKLETEDGLSSCTVGCDPPALMGNFTPGFVCSKKCVKKAWGIETLPDLSKKAR